MAPELPDWLASGIAAPPPERLRQRRTVTKTDGVWLDVDGQRLLGFCSNDYLGLAQDPALCEAMLAGVRRWGIGSGASHMVSGHCAAHSALERRAAAWLSCDRALLFSSGYLANLAAVTALAGPNVSLYADRLNHACLNDGARLAGGRLRRYPHADTDTLARWLANDPNPQKWVITDGVFSMDGDIAPLRRLLELCHAYDAMLLVDDAHGFGVLGEGRGSLAASGLLVQGQPLDPRIVLMVTLGKAAGVCGALLLGSAPVIDAVAQRGRSYLFTTAMPPALAEAADAALQRLADADCAGRRAHLAALTAELAAGLVGVDGVPAILPTPIVPVLVGSDTAAVALAGALREAGLWVPAIRPPTVPKGTARLRISLSARHRPEHVEHLVYALKESLVHG